MGGHRRSVKREGLGMSNVCEAFREFMSAQREELRREIDLDKWFLSEREGHDIGWTIAEQHYLEKYLPEFAKRFREEFCHKRCSKKERCFLKGKI